MITVKNMAKSYGKIQAVKDVSFEAKDGEITTLLGVNGSGKTTILRSICGLLHPDSGEITVDGILVAEDAQAARTKLGFVPDEFGLYPRLTAREHMDYFAELHGLEGGVLKEAVDKTIKLLHLENIADRRTDGFSLGERAKVAMARALVYDANNVILDEPTRGLDVMSIRLVRGLLGELRDEGRAILFSSHVMAEVAELSDRVVIIAGGLIVADDTPTNLVAKTKTKNLEDAFVALTSGQELAA
jgi:sodium transport system ATP-binding protein